MNKRLPLLLLLSVILFPAVAGGAAPAWPSLGDQLRAAGAPAGSALARLIAANQDFSLLWPGEAKDHIRVPLWLRVYWRRVHPEAVYSADDPTGGYPLVLKEVYEWMASHPDLVPGKAARSALPDFDEEAATVGGEKRISGLQTVSRSESDIRVNYWDPAKILSASNNIGGSGAQAVYYSADGGVTWGQTALPLISGDSFHSDPTVDWTSDGTAWSTTIGITTGGALQMRSYKSTNNGATWTLDATFSGGQTDADKQMIWVDHSASSPYRDNLYAIWHNGTPAYMNRRTGPSGAWQTPIQVSGAESSGTVIGGDVKTNAYGDVFGFWPATGNGGIFVVKSTNGGASYGTPVRAATTHATYDIGLPAMDSRRALIYVSGGAFRTASKNMVYAAWTDLTGASGCTSGGNEPGTNTASTCKTRIWFARSADGGATWSAPAMLNNQASLNDQFNQALVVDESSGALGVMYYDTVGDPNRLKVDVWYQSSFDDGATWTSAVKVTSAQTDETSAGADSGNQFGDYNSLSGIAGQFFPSWTDRRNNAREEIWTAKVTDLLCAVPGAPAIGAATATGPNQIQVSWSNGSPAATQFSVERAAGTCASHGPFAAAAGALSGSPYLDATVSGGLTYAYQVRGSDATGRCQSAPSGCAQATATGACTLQPAFSGLGSAANAGTASCGINLSWTAATPACGGPVSYNVYRSTTSGFTPGPGNRIAANVFGTSYTDGSAALANGTKYFYVVRAMDGSSGVEDGNTAQRNVTLTGPVANALSDTFEGAGGFDAAGWTHAVLSGSNDWAWSPAASQSPTHSWFSASSPRTGDRVLVTPSWTPRPGSTLTFWHTYAFESGASCYDAGTLEASTDGGATWSVVPDAAFLAGGFNGTVYTGYLNPLAGKRAWCGGAIGPMTQVMVDLSSYAGAPSLQLRWHAGDDGSVAATGWYVDSVTVTSPAVCTPNGLFGDGFESGGLDAWGGWTP